MPIAIALIAALASGMPASGTQMPVQISGGKKVDVHATAAAAQDASLLVVYESTLLGVIGLHHSRSTDGGATWSPPQPLWPEQFFPGRDTYSHPALVAVGTGFRLAYYDRVHHPGGIGNRIGLARSVDGIDFVQDPAGLDLGWNDGAEINPHLLAQADGSLTLVYQRQDQAFLARSFDGGITWDHLRTLVADAAAKPRIARRAADGLYLLVWEDSDGNGIKARVSTEPYVWTSPAISLVQDTPSREGTPVALFDGSFMVFYASHVAADFDIYSRALSSSGDWLPQTLQIRQGSPGIDDFQPTPLASSVPGGLHLFWSHGRAPPVLAYTHVFTQWITTSEDSLFAHGFEAAQAGDSAQIQPP